MSDGLSITNVVMFICGIFFSFKSNNKTNLINNKLNPDWFNTKGTTWPCVWLTATYHCMFMVTPPPQHTTLTLTPRPCYTLCSICSIDVGCAFLPLQLHPSSALHIMNGGDPFAERSRSREETWVVVVEECWRGARVRGEGSDLARGDTGWWMAERTESREENRRRDDGELSFHFPSVSLFWWWSPLLTHV